jgi:hypothetical protein
MKIILIALILALYPPYRPLSIAGDSLISSSYEFGERQITDFIENRDSLDNFDYLKYRFRLKQDIKDSFSYNISYIRQKRDYETRDSLDSRVNEYKLGLNFAISELTQLQAGFGHKEKHYKNTPSSEHNRDAFDIGLKHKLNPALSFGFDLGVINYDYFRDSASNQHKIYAGLNADYLLLNKRLKLGGFCRLQNVDQKGNKADRGEQIIGADINYKFNLRYLKDLRLTLEHGRDDTKEIEERDDNLRYRYSKWALKSNHPLSERLDTAFRYGQSRRDYFDSTSDYRGWFLESETDYEIFTSKQSALASSLKSEHKETDYHLDDSLNYLKDSLGVELTYNRKKNYKIIPSFTFSRYNYPANLNRKEKDYLTQIELIKEFERPDAKLKIKYAYKFRDFRYTADVAQWWVNLGIELGF